MLERSVLEKEDMSCLELFPFRGVALFGGVSIHLTLDFSLFTYTKIEFDISNSLSYLCLRKSQLYYKTGFSTVAFLKVLTLKRK